MEKPFFSVAFSAIRSNFYEEFYISLAKGSSIPFEIIFVGNKPPLKTMPDNFRYICTDVQPSQCIEIAVRNSTGEFVLPFSDDMLFSDNFLNNLYNWCNRLDTNKVLIGFRYLFEGKLLNDVFQFDPDIPFSPIVSLAPCFKRNVWEQLGGIDRRYYGSFGDFDIQMRMYEIGMNIFITPNCIIEERPPLKGEKKLFSRCGKYSRDFLRSCWVKSDGSFSYTRLLPVESFDDNDILIKNQGEKKVYGRFGSFKI